MRKVATKVRARVVHETARSRKPQLLVPGSNEDPPCGTGSPRGLQLSHVSHLEFPAPQNSNHGNPRLRAVPAAATVLITSALGLPVRSFATSRESHEWAGRCGDRTNSCLVSLQVGRIPTVSSTLTSASWRTYGTSVSVRGRSPTFSESLTCRSCSSPFAESAWTIFPS